MELVNHTRYPAGLARMVYGEDRIAASVLVRVTYDIKDGTLVPSEEQPWIVSNAPWESPQGMMDGDQIFYKEGVDVFLYGSAVPEGGRSTTQMDVEIRIGSAFQRRVRVFGPRVWRRGLAGLVPTAPLPFSEMPLALKHAFGGKDVWDGLEIPWQENPEGRGFYLTEDSAVDRPLPCVEEVDQLITKWDDRPAPAGLVHYPPTSPLRAKNGLVVVGQTAKLSPRFFNMAFPPMIADHARAGDAIRVTGISRDRQTLLALPEHAMRLRLRFGSETHDLSLGIDQIGIEFGRARVFLSYRYPFRYVLHEMQERSCELFGEDP
jgi:hypothetical protein